MNASNLRAALIALSLLTTVATRASDEPGGLTAEQVKAYFAIKNAQAKRDQSRVEYLFDEFKMSVPKGPPYSLEALESYQPRSLEDRRQEPNGPKVSLRIRRDYNDVLASEDSTVKDPKNDKEDIDGALLSWGRDLRSEADSWDLRGAVLLPVTWRTNRPDSMLAEWGAVPSVSLHKANSESEGAEETDSLVFRLGGWAGLTPKRPFYYHRLSAWASMATDTDMDGRVWAGEFDWEPRVHLGKRVGLGSYHSLLETTASDGSRTTILGYTLTAALHTEGGRVDDPGSTELEKGSFLRAGPRIKFILDPVFHKSLAASVEYTRLFDLEGDSPEPEYLRAALVWSPHEGRNWAVRLEYENGGLDLTQERVDQITAGLQIRF